MFAGFEVVRGAELATIEAGAFGIDHPAVGALWVESLGFPQPVADTIRCVAEPVAESETPLLLTLRSASALAASVAQKDPAEAALAALPSVVQARFSVGAGQPDAAFVKLYEALQETEPTF